MVRRFVDIAGGEHSTFKFSDLSCVILDVSLVARLILFTKTAQFGKDVIALAAFELLNCRINELRIGSAIQSIVVEYLTDLTYQKRARDTNAKAREPERDAEPSRTFEFRQ